MFFALARALFFSIIILRAVAVEEEVCVEGLSVQAHLEDEWRGTFC